jgi:hypothetical protein
MPDLKDIIKDKKKFVKNAYRPWDLTGNNTNSPSIIEVDAEEKDFPVESIKKNIIENNHSKTIESQLSTDTLDAKKSSEKENIINSIEPISISLKLKNLAGLQKKILSIIANAVSKETLETGPIQTKVIAENINASIGSTKMSISRLVEKGFISREKGRTAKGGFLNLRINQETYESLLTIKKQGEPLID